MRRRLAHNGLVIVVLDGKGQVHVEGLGLPLDEDYADFVAEAREDVAAALAKLKGGQRHDRDVVSEAARLAARRAAQALVGQEAAGPCDPAGGIERDEMDFDPRDLCCCSG